MKLIDLDRVFDNDRGPAAVPGVATPAAEMPGVDPDPEQLPEDWYKEYIERAAIMEFDYGATREYAEAYALRETLKDMRAAGEFPG